MSPLPYPVCLKRLLPGVFLGTVLVSVILLGAFSVQAAVPPASKVFFGNIEQSVFDEDGSDTSTGSLELDGIPLPPAPSIEEPGVVGFELHVRSLGSPVVVRVFPHSPAQRAGFHSGDVLLEVNGYHLSGLSREEVDACIPDTPGTAVSFTVLRQNKVRQLVAVVASLNHVPQASREWYQPILATWQQAHPQTVWPATQFSSSQMVQSR